ncbi:YesL family protein [Gracilibacillus kekensis]|uniref:Uncharacterized membrane protein YesL n=1 Tax=Gracilibacillus kekensis TaxID=1027249 RepID=A0A1M7KLT3_9BACI|nr:DUF624 domain-containing protein [Gracilibacillus kekensis]SHM66314.1 Uncharacterized membrane protein YesL [Gracilibacillus kekensis]
MHKGINVYIGIGEWLFKIILLNLYWFLFTVLGLLFLGLFPATVALFATIRQDLKSEDDSKLFKTFISYYKSEFIKGNILGYLFVLIMGILFINIRILGNIEFSTLNSSLMIVTYILMGIVFLVSLYIFPIYVHYNLSIIGYIKYSAVLFIGKPLQTLFLLLSLAVLCYFFYQFPGFIPAISGSLIAYIIMRVSYSSFQIEEKQS